MPAYDATILDRLAELETRLRRADADLAITRRRVSELTTAVLVRPAITREHSVDEDYPRYAADEADLPVVTVEPYPLDESAEEWDDRFSEPQITVASKFWLPPESSCGIAWVRDRWVIVEAPKKLIGITTARIPAAVYTYASSAWSVVSGRGTVQLFEQSRENADANEYTPQLYADDDPVTMQWVNREPRPIPPGEILAAVRNRSHDWVMQIDDPMTGGCLAGDHPGRGTAFDIHLGVWIAASTSWIYLYDTVKAIDWRYGVPYPDAGATGLFVPRRDETNGTIWECVSLDCESPESCNTEEAPS